MKLLIIKPDFASPFPTLSPNAKDAQINDCIYITQDSNFRGVIGDALYDDIMSIFNIESAIVGISSGAQTAINLQSANGLEIGYFVSFFGVNGTMGDLLNGKRFEIVGILGNQITINTDSTGKVWANGGALEKVFTPQYNTLFAYIKPYLVYGSYAKYFKIAPLQSTASGIMQHTVGEAQHPTDKQRGEVVNQYTEEQRNRAERLVKFLSENSESYPLFSIFDKKIVENANPTFVKAKTNSIIGVGM